MMEYKNHSLFFIHVLTLFLLRTMERSEKSRQAVVSIGESQPDGSENLLTYSSCYSCTIDILTFCLFWLPTEAKKVVTDVRVQLEKERERAATGRQKNPKRFLKATSVSNLDQKQTRKTKRETKRKIEENAASPLLPLPPLYQFLFMFALSFLFLLLLVLTCVFLFFLSSPY